MISYRFSSKYGKVRVMYISAILIPVAVLLDELYITHHQRRYPATLINKGFKIAEKIPLKELQTPKNIATKNP